MSKITDDPRDASLEVKFSVPNTWHEDTTDLSSTGMMFSGLIMVTRNRYLAWPAVALSLNGWINKHPLRSKDGGGASLSNVSLCIMALVASYLPMFMVTKNPAAFNTAPSS
ncbi:hypothetical protein L218DRAFT_883157 [Marasmius fiardii PR-910]|nr:hypothetical protein L218DRAFT_883157 [Marasmius fiardii PR-910]